MTIPQVWESPFVIRKCHQYLVFLFFFWHNFFDFFLCSESFTRHTEHLHLWYFTIFLHFQFLANSRDLLAKAASVCCPFPPPQVHSSKVAPPSLPLYTETSGHDMGAPGKRTWWLVMPCHNGWKSTKSLVGWWEVVRQLDKIKKVPIRTARISWLPISIAHTNNPERYEQSKIVLAFQTQYLQSLYWLSHLSMHSWSHYLISRKNFFSKDLNTHKYIYTNQDNKCIFHSQKFPYNPLQLQSTTMWSSKL